VVNDFQVDAHFMAIQPQVPKNFLAYIQAHLIFLKQSVTNLGWTTHFVPEIMKYVDGMHRKMKNKNRKRTIRMDGNKISTGRLIRINV
jgi:hypothetical protein